LILLFPSLTFWLDRENLLLALIAHAGAGVLDGHVDHVAFYRGANHNCAVTFDRLRASLKAAQPTTPWTQIAHTLGYFDQMHMVHDFNRLSGESPGLIFGQLDMFVKPEVPVGDGPQLS
jgi:AraC-like DNA-binding protein